MKRLCVFCGSSLGARSDYLAAARQLGQLLAQKKIGLVYGGGRVGLMGHLARTVLEGRGEVIGVIPRQLVERELAFSQVSDLRVVNSMHERKAMMADLSDGFIALPGGLGTIEELFEVLTWSQLGFHQKPCGLLNAGDYFRRLIDFVDYAVEEQFIDPAHRSLLLVDTDPEALLRKLEAHRPAGVDKAWWALGRRKG